MDLFFIFKFRMLTLYAIVNNTFENFQQSVLHILYSLEEDKIRYSMIRGLWKKLAISLVNGISKCLSHQQKR